MIRISVSLTHPIGIIINRVRVEMGIFENKESERFEFSVSVNPRSAGDFGAVRIGGRYRDIGDCISAFNEMSEQIDRHVDGVESLEVVISDAFGEYADVPKWWYEQEVRKIAKEKGVSTWQVGWDDIKGKLPKAKPSPDDVKGHLSYLVDFLEKHKGNITNDDIDSLIEESKEFID